MQSQYTRIARPESCNKYHTKLAYQSREHAIPRQDFEKHSAMKLSIVVPFDESLADLAVLKCAKIREPDHSLVMQLFA